MSSPASLGTSGGVGRIDPSEGTNQSHHVIEAEVDVEDLFGRSLLPPGLTVPVLILDECTNLVALPAVLLPRGSWGIIAGDD